LEKKVLYFLYWFFNYQLFESSRFSIFGIIGISSTKIGHFSAFMLITIDFYRFPITQIDPAASTSCLFLKRMVF
jgi:hypothetical protein